MMPMPPITKQANGDLFWSHRQHWSVTIDGNKDVNVFEMGGGDEIVFFNSCIFLYIRVYILEAVVVTVVSC